MKFFLFQLTSKYHGKVTIDISTHKNMINEWFNTPKRSDSNSNIFLIKFKIMVLTHFHSLAIPHFPRSGIHENMKPTAGAFVNFKWNPVNEMGLWKTCIDFKNCLKLTFEKWSRLSRGFFSSASQYMSPFYWTYRTPIGGAIIISIEWTELEPQLKRDRLS